MAEMTENARTMARAPHAGRDWPWLLALGLIAFLAFLPGVNYPFLNEWDDSAYVTGSEMLPNWVNVKYWLSHATVGGFTPLTMWSLMLDRWLFGLTPLAFHIHNQLLHCLATLLLYGIARQLRVSPWAAFLLALLWAVHPQRVESVVWITERKDMLSGVFGFGSMLLFMRSFDRGRLPWAAAAVLLLALASKPSTVTLPAVMAVYAFWRRPTLDSLRPLAPILAMSCAFTLCFYMLSRSAVHGVLEQIPRLLLVPSHNAVWFLITAVIPFELSPVYPRVAYELRTWLVLGAGLTLALTGVVAWWRCVDDKRAFLAGALPFAAAWLFLFLPVSALLRFAHTDYCDRFNYLLSAITWLALGALVDRWAQGANRRKLAAYVGLCAAAIYLCMTWSYLPYWQNGKTLFTYAVDQVEYPNERAMLGLGVVGLYHKDQAMLEAAADRYLANANANAKIPLPGELKQPEAMISTGLFFTGMALKNANRPTEAWRALQEVEKLCRKDRLLLPEDIAGRFWGELGGSYLEAGRQQDALRCFRNQLPFLKPDSLEERFCRGITAFLTKDYQGARREWRLALELQPDDSNTLSNLRSLEANYLMNNAAGTMKETRR